MQPSSAEIPALKGPAAAPRFDQPEGERACVLVVDDDDGKRGALAAIVGAMQLDVMQAASGRDALRQLLKRDFALILLDVRMPVMDGYETAQMIHDRPRSMHTPIIFVSAEAGSDDERARGYAIGGAVDWLCAPVVREVLQAKVRGFVNLFYLNRVARRQAEELERHAQEITRKNLQLEEASMLKSNFLANMSHELRTPLNAIIGFTGTLLMKLGGPLTVEQDKQLKTIQSSARHLLLLINDILDVAKIEAGKVELTLEAVPCQALISELGETVRPLAQQQGLALVLDLPAGAIVLRTDRRALSQIVLNLLSNAIKFTEQGEVRVSLAQRCERNRRWTEICVIDSGVGIKPEDQARLFKAFSQLDCGLTRRFEGTGLGLYLSQKLATLLGGSLSLKSACGAGSTFTLTLPAEN